VRKKELHILGAGGHAKVVVALAQALGIRIAGIYANDKGVPLLEDVPTLPLSRVPDLPSTHGVIAIGSNAARQRIAASFQQLTWARLIHPTAWISPDVKVGAGTVVMAGVIIQPGTQLGTHVIVNTSSSVDHDCKLNDFVHVAPGCHLAGNVSLADGVFAGISSAFIPGTQVGAWSVVGAGSVVTRSLAANTTSVGVPAKVIKDRPEGWHLE